MTKKNAPKPKGSTPPNGDPIPQPVDSKLGDDPPENEPPPQGPSNSGEPAPSKTIEQVALDAIREELRVPLRPQIGWWRLAVSLVFLLLGIGGVFYVITQVPAMTAEFVAEQERVRSTGLESTLRTVIEKLGTEEMQRQSLLLTRIDATFQTMSQSLGGFKDALPWFPKAKEQVEAALKEWDDLKKSLEGAKSNLDKALQWATAVPAPADGATAPPDQKTVLAVLSEVNATLAGAKTPESLNSSFAAIKHQLSVFAELTQALPKGKYNRSWLDINAMPEPGKSRLLGLVYPSAEAATKTMLDELEKAQAAIPTNSLVLISDASAKDAIEKLQAAYSDTSVAANKLGAFVANTADSLNGVKATLETTLGGAMYKQLVTEKEQDNVVARISTASDAIRANLSTSTEARDLVDSARRAVQSLQGLVATQNDMAFRAASPAFLVMLALAAMFTVFGTTSLLRMLKTIEQDRTDTLWRQRAQVYVTIASHLAGTGLDPAEFLRELQRIRFGDEREKPVIGTPVLATLSELAAGLKGKGT